MEKAILALVGKDPERPRPPRLAWEQLRAALAHEGLSPDDEELVRLPFQVETIQTDNGAEFQSAFGIASRALAERVRRAVVEKLKHEPVEDYRIDFEDGYGTRDDTEEDGHAVSAAGGFTFHR